MVEILLEKMRKFFLNTMQKIAENSLSFPRNIVKKNEMISLGYVVNDHVCSKSKSI